MTDILPSKEVTAADFTLQQEEPSDNWPFGACSDEDAEVWDYVEYSAYFDRRMTANGSYLLVAVERLLDPSAFGLTDQEAREQVQAIIRQIRYGYEGEYKPPSDFWCKVGEIVVQPSLPLFE